jgi:AcrR family transcriptional regulator
MSRPPSQQAHEAVLKATLDLVADKGIEGSSVDEIASMSGVSKATIYKHWTNKEALCLEAIGRLKCDGPAFDSGHPRSDVVEMLRHLAVSQKPEAFSKIWPRVISYAESNPAFGEAFRARIYGERRAQLGALLQAAVAQGELRGSLDVDLAMDLLFGPIMYHRFMQATVPADLPKLVVDSFWRLNTPRGKRKTRKSRSNGRKP